MPIRLLVRTFSAALLPELAAFDCGQDEFGRIATNWIRCVDPSDCAISSMTLGNEVFLYNAQDGTPVGFGSLGKTPRTVRRAKEEWSIIPQVGIDYTLRGQPPGPDWQERYSTAIMLDLIGAARDHATPTLMLKVHQRNKGAIRLYGRLGFKKISGPNSGGYDTMTIENHD